MCVVAIASIVLWSGCATTVKMYEGPRRASGETAVLECSSPAYIKTVDGQAESPDGVSFTMKAVRLLMEPGSHEFLVFCHARRGVGGGGAYEIIGRGTKVVKCTLRAGGKYRIAALLAPGIPVGRGGVFEWQATLEMVGEGSSSEN